MHARYRIQSACECQGLLEADLDADRQVVRGRATPRGGAAEAAPANSVGADAERFDVVWQCPICGRNTLRTFHVGALVELPPPPPEPASDDTAAGDTAAGDTAAGDDSTAA